LPIFPWFPLIIFGGLWSMAFDALETGHRGENPRHSADAGLEKRQ
jgi:hypothetical protein